MRALDFPEILPWSGIGAIQLGDSRRDVRHDYDEAGHRYYAGGYYYGGDTVGNMYAGIFVNGGTLTLDHATLTDNSHDGVYAIGSAPSITTSTIAVAISSSAEAAS